MRKWHRWLSVVFGAFILFIAVTGVGSHLADFYAEASSPPAASVEPPGAAPAGPAAPEASRPPRSPARQLVGTLHHLHSGETFGPAGVAISLLSGFGLIFFAVSGMWMYVDMFRRRARNRREGEAGRRRWFW